MIQFYKCFFLYLMLMLFGIPAITIVWQIGILALIGLYILPFLILFDQGSVIYKLLNLFYTLLTISIFGVLIAVIIYGTNSPYLGVLASWSAEFIMSFLYFLGLSALTAILYKLYTKISIK